MSEKTMDEKEAYYNIQLKQVSLEQEIKDREIRKQEQRLNDFQELETIEQRFYSESFHSELDKPTNNFFQQAVDESRWLAREEREHLETRNEELHVEKRLLLAKEDELLMARKQLFIEKGSDSTWD